jgi:hypothetical protein
MCFLSCAEDDVKMQSKNSEQVKKIEATIIWEQEEMKKSYLRIVSDLVIKKVLF